MSAPESASGLELAEQLHLRRTSSEELTRYFLDRIERHNPSLQAFVHIQGSAALRRARRLDKQRKGRDARTLPCFWGVPTAIKDLVPVRGTPTRLGSRAYRYFISPIDAPIAKRIKAGGFVSLGKLATSEFGAMPVTETDIHPPTRNPFNTEHTPGGSSGGSGSAVAAGLLPLAHGSDGGGSVRIPSALCHLFGFKPSVMLLGNLHGPVNRLGLSTMGPLCHTVEDAAAMLDVMSGRNDDPYASSTLLAHCRQKPRRRKIALCMDPPFGEVDPLIRQGVERAAKVLEELGHEIVERPRLELPLAEFLPLWKFALAAVPTFDDKSLQPITRWLRAEGRKLKLGDMHALQRELSEFIYTLLGDADNILAPTVPVLAPKIGAFDHDPPPKAFDKAAVLGAMTAGFNVTGQPAASIPAGICEKTRLPYAIQLAGRVGHDGDLFALCREMEEAMPWRERNKPLV
jgi:amidase